MQRDVTAAFLLPALLENQCASLKNVPSHKLYEHGETNTVKRSRPQGAGGAGGAGCADQTLHRLLQRSHKTELNF